MSQPPTPPQHVLPTNTQPFPGSLTPGWNDPPSVQYSAQATGTPGRTKLNKRVPFPLQQTNTGGAKPTAIVQPCPAMGTSSNIAVVHPLQHNNIEDSPVRTPAPTATLTLDSMPQPSQQSSTREASGSQNLVPTMFVPAVPRQTDTTQGSVQHL